MGKQHTIVTPPPPRSAVLIHNLTNLAIFGVIVFMLYLAWPLIVERFTGVAPMLPTLPTAAVAQPRPQAPAQQPAAPPVAAPTPYTQATAEAIADHAYQQAIQQAELNAAPLPNDQKEVVQSAPGVNADWCRGSHLSRPECQPGNGQKVER